MRAVTWIFLPDAREGGPSLNSLNERIRDMVHNRLAGGVVYNAHQTSFAMHYPTVWTTRSEEVDPHLVLLCVREVDWEYPLLVAWRSEQENQWNFSRMGLAPATLSGGREEEAWTRSTGGSSSP